MLKKIKRLYRIITSFPSFLNAFYRSASYRSWRSGALTLDEALKDFDDQERREHEKVMEMLHRKRWALGQRYKVRLAQCQKMKGALERRGEELARLRREKESLS